ncbi:MAG: phosphoribosylanthranilate isomerase [Bacillota bacterium]|jgi:phosphoribosylanthranilate isomerase
MTWIKICGITNSDDAEKAVALGADALGFIFASSLRKVLPERVREITAGLPESVEKIGVFLNHPEEQVREIAGFCRLTGLQFHGSEPLDYCMKFQDFDVIKVFRINKKIDRHEISPYLKGRAIRRIILDTFVLDKPGGTGKRFPWELVTEQDWIGVPIIIAGGITPKNARVVIRQAKPFGIDVSSGVEKKPGCKDEYKMKLLIEQVREAK